MPRLANRKRQFTRAIRYSNDVECKVKCVSVVSSMADIIVQNARGIGLDVCADEITPGDGNYFYHAIVQQVHRPVIRDEVTSLLTTSHSELRGMVCQYIWLHQNEIEYIRDYRTLYNQTLHVDHNHITWSDFINEQSYNGTYATELFIKATAVMIGIDIHIISELCTREHQFNIITAVWDGTPTFNSPPLMIGNISGVHFQSLLPTEVAPTMGSHLLRLQTDIQTINLHDNLHHMKLRSHTVSYNNTYNIQHSLEEQLITNQMGKKVEPPSDLHYLGMMVRKCDHCASISFTNELFKCCHNGKVKLDHLSHYPDEMIQLMVGDSTQPLNFQKNIRQYNSAFAFASMGATLATPPGHGPPCFRICGQIYHRSGTLHPPDGEVPVFSQLYIIETNTALNHRMCQTANKSCRDDVMRSIQQVMEECSPYIKAYRHMADIEKYEMTKSNRIGECRIPSIQLHFRTGNDRRRYNVPHHDEIAMIFVGDDGAPPIHRDVVVYPRDRPLHKISYMSANCDPMIYPLLFPHGDSGWHCDLQHIHEYSTSKRNHVTMLQFYTYRLAIRDGFSAIYHSRKLFQQYLVDAYVKVESQRLDFIRRNQQQLRVERYQGLMDELSNRSNDSNLHPGKIVILPSTFQGSPRSLQQNYQDAMTIIAKFGKPDLFLTFTCNPKWREITDNLSNGEQPFNRPDLLARVFKLKLNELLDDITVHHVLGKVVAKVHVIKFQKRGLPHCHLLIHFHPDNKLRNRDDIDRIISAELPDVNESPRLHAIVKSCMIHGPCGHVRPNSICMDEGVCTKGYPKEYSAHTLESVDGYPRYRRRDNGRTIKVMDVELDNRWVVPYNPWLLLKYAAHINVEACMSIKSVKYLYKYVYKGHDCVQLEFSEHLEHDEIHTFVDARYVSAPEAAWRLFEFPMHHQSHTIVRLAIHLPNEQKIYFREGQEVQALHNACDRDTHLTAWFKLNESDESANGLLYTEIPKSYIFDINTRKWQKRKRGGNKVIS